MPEPSLWMCLGVSNSEPRTLEIPISLFPDPFPRSRPLPLPVGSPNSLSAPPLLLFYKLLPFCLCYSPSPRSQLRTPFPFSLQALPSAPLGPALFLYLGPSLSDFLGSFFFFSFVKMFIAKNYIASYTVYHPETDQWAERINCMVNTELHTKY